MVGQNALHYKRSRAEIVGVFALCILLLVGCGSPDNERANGESPPVDTKAADIDKLRSLPYASFTPDPVPEGESGTVRLDTTRSYPGYNFCTTRDLSMAELVDARGELIHRWQGTPGMWRRSVLLLDGDLLVVGADERENRYALRMSWDGEVLWKTDVEGHHDIGPTSDGRVMVLTMEARRLPDVSSSIDVRDDGITIMSEQGAIVEHRSLYDVMAGHPDIFTFGEVKPQGRWVDLFHANSVRWMMHEHLREQHPIYSPDNVIVCIRHQDTVAIFNWRNSELLWAWGQGEISGPHDASVLANGHLLIFDNGLARGWSRVIEIDPLSKEIVWEYRAPEPRDFFTYGRGACQRLPNGNTVITESDTGRAFEVTREGQIVWEYFNPHVDIKRRRATFIRVYRLELDFVEQILKQQAPR